MKPISIVIVGGGTAGWIAASALQRRLAGNQERPVTITLIESKRIGIIGVGEATVPTIRSLFRFLDISEQELIRATDATFKHGILYKDWKYPPGTPNNTYFHPFDYSGIMNFSPQLWWLATRAHLPDAHYAGDVGTQYAVAMAGKAPRRRDMPPYDGVNGYAYHMDAERLAEFLANRAITAGVVRLFDDVLEAKTAADGSIDAVVTAEHGTIEGDFFVDCTGFAGLLMSKTLGIGFVSYNDTLFCDKAVALRMPGEPGDELRPFTTTTAKSAGWIWDIDLQRRHGIGYVYSSRHTSPEQAEAELRRHIGARAEGLEARHLRMRVGRSESFWHKNVAVIGLAGGFIEPLESTGIFLIQFGALLLADSLQGMLGLAVGSGPDSRDNSTDRGAYFAALETLSPIYNSRMIGLYEETRDFIKLHYFLTGRRDTPFWRDNVERSSAPNSLLELLDRWSFRPPQQFDFPSRFALFAEGSWLYVMLGMGWRPKTIEAFRPFIQLEMGQRLIDKVAEDTKRALAALPDHRAYFMA